MLMALLFFAATGLGGRASAQVTLVVNPAALENGPHVLEQFEDDLLEPGIAYTCEPAPCVRRAAYGTAGGVTPSGSFGYSTGIYAPYSMTFDLTSPTNSFGLWFGNDETCCSTGFDATLRLFDGNVFIGSVSVAANMNDWADQFIGFNSDVLVTRVELLYDDGDGMVSLVPYIDDLYFNVQPRCGNGVIEPGELCDDGDTDDGNCCDAACQLAAPDGTPCNGIGNACAPQDFCGAGSCIDSGSLPNGASCDDGITCNGADICYDSACFHAATCTDSLDDFKCYRARDLRNPPFVPIKRPGIPLSDPLTSEPDIAVKRLALVCLSATKSTVPPLGYDQMCCYRIGGRPPEAGTMEIADAFGTLQVAMRRPDLLCQPCTGDLLPLEPAR